MSLRNWLPSAADDADVARLPPLAGLDAVTIAQAIHLLDRSPLFQALAERMSSRGRIAVIANGSPIWLRDLDSSRALKAYLQEWLGTPLRSACGTDPSARAGFRMELAAAGFGAAVEVRRRRWTRSRSRSTRSATCGSTSSALGAGGQSVNTTDSAVRVTHLPTGLVVEIQDEKSQHKNKAKAMSVLRSRLYDLQQQKQREADSATRRSMIGGGDRSDKVRTYNFPQDRVTDHRIGKSLHNLPAVMDGELDDLIDALLMADQADRLGSLTESGAA